jgi:hypothetical protein
MINKDEISRSDLTKLRSFLERDSKLCFVKISSLEDQIKELNETLKNTEREYFLYNMRRLEKVCLQETISAVFSGKISDIYSPGNKDDVSRSTGLINIVEGGYGSNQVSRWSEWNKPSLLKAKELLEGYLLEIEQDNERERLLEEEAKQKAVNDFYDKLL